DIAARFRRQDARLTAGYLSRNDRRNAGIEDNAVWPFPVRMNTDDGPIGRCPFIRRHPRKKCIQNEQQREQYSANVGKISREWHVLLHCGAAPASTEIRARFCFGKMSAVLQRFSVERSATRKFADTHQRRPARSTGPPRTIWRSHGANAWCCHSAR